MTQLISEQILNLSHYMVKFWFCCGNEFICADHPYLTKNEQLILEMLILDGLVKRLNYFEMDGHFSFQTYELTKRGKEIFGYIIL